MGKDEILSLEPGEVAETAAFFVFIDRSCCPRLPLN